MRGIRNLLRRLKHSPASRQGKKGSSLALVMMIGAVLVIWVMCIMPLMTTAGTAAYKTEGNYDDYLLGRSAVEYCKSELEKIVEEKIPYTFAVTGDLDTGFTTVPKWNDNGLTVRPEYSALVDSPDPLDDRKDTPESDSVVAICAVEPKADEPNVYELVMTTYKKCEKTLSYTAIFTGKGSLLIYPEAYRQNQALPLSDFVVVDGKMGPNTVWNSTITMSNASSLGFRETLLPWIAPTSSEWSDSYANTGEYPAVFKTTVHSASDGNVNISDPVTMGDLASDQRWEVPKAGNSGTPGNIWFVKQNGKIQIKMYTTRTVDITSDCTVYLNGRVTYDLEVPASGIYKVSVDYTGTDYSTEEKPDKYDSEQVNVLPINGLQLSGEIDQVSVGTNTLSETVKIHDIDKEEHKDWYGRVEYTTYTVELTRPAEDLLYGMADEDGKVTWQSENSFTFRDPEEGDAYFFYFCRPATYVDGVFKTASEVKMAGMIYMPKFVNSLENGGKYAMMGQAGSDYYQLNSDLTVSAVAMDEGFMIGEQEIGSDVWTVGTSSRSMSFRGPDGKYLTVTGEAKANFLNGYYKQDHSHNGDRFRCYKTRVSLDEFESVSLGLTSDYKAFSYSRSESSYQIYTRAVDEDVKYLEWRCTETATEYNRERTTSLTDNKDSYLSLNASATTSYSRSYVKFMQAPPAAPTSVKAPGAEVDVDDTVTYGTDVLNHVRDELDGFELLSLYANGQEVTGALNTGKYHLIAKIKSNDLELFLNLGNLTVNKAGLNDDGITVNAVRDDTDELRIDVSATGWHSNGGIRYYGYKTTAETEYHWYTTDDEIYTFRLPYGKYNFAVRETGTNNYNGVTAEYGNVIELKAQPVSADDININDFIYTFDPNITDDPDTLEDERVKWYRLPEKLIPSRVKLVYGYYWERTGLFADSNLSWREEYAGESISAWYNWSYRTHNLRYYGVIIEGSPYSSIDNVFQISQPVNINTINGHTTSLMRGSSLYFMGRGSSMDTFGTDIFLNTDLLVLYADISGGGSVVVEPYSTGDGRPGDVLFFVANPSGIVRDGNTIFEGRTFYRIPANTNLCNLNAATTAAWKVGDIYDEDVKYLFRQGVYPEINLDIAYTSTEQLARIINSETIGWTVDGVLSGSSTSTNPGYAVTAYVTGMNGVTSYKANRILIAANTGTSKTLDVTSDLTLTTRYLSVEADQIVGNGTRFILNNLAQDQGFVQWISNALGLTNYSSKSLQMDYERNTMIISGSSTTPVLKQICRYESGTNLLGQAENMSLTAEYTTSEIENLFNNGFVSSIFGSTVKTVDRYVSLKADNSDGEINITSWITGSHLDIYANYVYVDSTVKEIDMSSWLGGSDIRISSQESGYTTQEYLGIFKGHSAETYTGTILYFADSVRVNLGGSPKTVSSGFYWIDATDNGTSLTVLADRPQDYRIDPEELKDYSIYINADGTLSNAYVDTGLEDNNSATVGGFSGGSIE